MQRRLSATACRVTSSLLLGIRRCHHCSNSSAAGAASCESDSTVVKSIHPVEAAEEEGEIGGGASSTAALAKYGQISGEDNESWIRTHVDRAVSSGRETPEAAAYFCSILRDQKDFSKCLAESRRLIGDQNPERMTRYQQGQFADRLNTFMSGIASESLRRAHAEEQSTKQHTKDGTPTGEQFWFEAGSTLASPGVPTYLKDEILRDMQRERSPDSPAFEEPKKGEFLAADDEGYAAHLRQQRRRLLHDADFNTRSQ